MIDFILRFPSKQVAEQFGLANGFAQQDGDGEIVSNLASHEHALCVIGEHNGSDWWVLFRDLVGIPIPEGGEQFIYWASDWMVLGEDGQEIPIDRPVDDPNIPDIWWA
jgi:hypothetical protein